MEKIALCILSYRGLAKPEYWKPFYDSGKYNLYLHHKDELEDMSEYHDWEKQFAIENRVYTEWGHIGLVKATLELYRAALKDPENQRFLLISGDSIPLQGPKYIHEKMFNFNGNHIGKCSFDRKEKRKRYRGISNKKSVPFWKFIKHGQWITLNRRTVEFFTQNSFEENWENCWIPDESFFGTICNVHNISYSKIKYTFTRWSGRRRRHPDTFENLSKPFLREKSEKGWLFLRKVSWITKIDEYLKKHIDES